MAIDVCMAYIFIMLMLVSTTLTLRQTRKRGIISTIKQAVSILLAVTVRAKGKFYFSLKSSVLFIVNYGHTKISCKTHVRSLVSAYHSVVPTFRERFWCRDEICNFTIALACHVDMASNQTIASHSTDSAADKWRRGDWFNFSQGQVHCLECVDVQLLYHCVWEYYAWLILTCTKSKHLDAALAIDL